MLPTLLALAIGQAAAKPSVKAPPPKPPVYASASAKEMVRVAIAAYDKLRHVAYDVTDESESRRIWMSGSRLREQSPGVTWIYNGTTLAIIDNKSKNFYSGKIGRGQISVSLAKLGARMDPTLRFVFRKVNPIRRALLPGSKVRLAGQMMLDGKRCRVVEIKRGEIVVQLLVRPDGLLAQSSTTIDPKIGEGSKYQREFRYFHVGNPLDRATFSIARPRGFAAKPLSALPQKKGS